MADRSTLRGYRHVCPVWCDRGSCSELVSVRTEDARVTLAWVRADEVDAQGPGVPELRVDITCATPGHDARLFLTPLEAYRLAEQLLGLCWRECYQRALVVGAGRVVAS